MKILVTGGAGYIGSITTEMLLDEGHEVVVFDNLERGHREAVDARARFIEGDLRDKDGTFAMMAGVRPDAVLHFAAYALVGESMEHPDMYFRNNIVGGVNLAEAMVREDVGRIVFSSTCASYGQPEVVPITEDTPQRPENAYGDSKIAFERVLRWYHELRGMHTIYLRYFNACGATAKFGEDHDPETHLIPLVLKAALGQRKKVMIFGDDYDTPDGTCVRDYIHIADLARAHLLALRSDFSGPINLGNGQGHSVRQVIETAREVTGINIPAEMAPRRPGDPPTLVASAQRARTVLGWQPQHPDLRAIVSSAWAWHRAHPNGYAG